MIVQKINKHEFEHNAVVFIKSLFNKKLCMNAHDYILDNEKAIIEKYAKDSRGLALESTADRKIKYFEHPLKENFSLFGQFVNSDVLQIGEYLLGTPVYIYSCEVHSRSPGGTAIPPHQDNAYYGLEKGNALTFYIALNPQRSLDGGLTYVKHNLVDLNNHVLSNESAFSLEIQDKSSLTTKEKILFDYQPGDCTIHHSNSIHFAEPVVENATRGLVFRITVFSQCDKQKEGHAEWYSAMIKSNRSKP